MRKNLELELLKGTNYPEEISFYGRIILEWVLG
jgi:hypothetical protein